MKVNSIERVAISGLFMFLFGLMDTASANNYVRDTAISPPLITTKYNDTFYNSVLEAAMGIAQPYLLQQKYYTMAGVTVSGNSIVSNGITYPVTESYFNPGTGYYIASTSYAQYGVSNFKSVWPTQCPNAFYDTATHSFNAKIDCVGFGTRLLSAVGGTTATTNPYLNLINRIKANNTGLIASKGFVASAYEFAVDFATLKTAPKPGWAYIAGDVCTTSVIDGYNKTLQGGLGTYNGVRKGGFALCQPGDVMAFAYDSTSSSNGHFMILERQPQLLDATGLQTYYPKVSSTKVKAFVTAHKVYAVPVIDDSGKSAHFNDSRTSYGGIGHGTVLIVADTADDAPVGFIFSPSTSITYSPVDTSHCYAISVGRYTSASQLPLTLSAFEAAVENGEVVLNWQTTTELNTSVFNIQHSVDGVNFTTLGNVKATGSGANRYKMVDSNPYKGVNYYRLQVVDKDGETNYSKLVSLGLSVSIKEVSVFPNPSKSFITVKGDGIDCVEIIDNLGKVVSRELLKEASNPLITISTLKAGIYHLRVHTNSGCYYSASFIKE